jgi:hydroxylamine reductase (hybrid-cluster protein)
MVLASAIKTVLNGERQIPRVPVAMEVEYLGQKKIARP